MRRSQFEHIVFGMAGGVLTLTGLLLLLNGAVQTAYANPGDLFVTTAGSGSSCTQAQPCALQTALSQALAGDTIYVAGGVYTGSGGAVITVTKTITLYGGWNGSLVYPPVRDPAVYSTTLDGQGQRRVVYIGAGVPLLDGFIITRGQADYSGGGIRVESASPIIRNNTIISNSADGDGGAIFVNRGATQILGNRIISNTATWAGGLRIINDANVTIVGNEIRNNVAAISAGGIDLECCGGVTSLIAGNVIVDNNGGNSGGGVQVDGAHARLVNNILVGNQATNGAGVRLEGASYLIARVELINNTLVGCSSGDQAVWVDAYVAVTLTNNILAHHATGVTSTDPASSIVHADANLFWNDSDPLVGGNSIRQDPLLLPDQHLTSTSPAINKGKPNPWAPTDIDGDPRPDWCFFDLGADEFITGNQCQYVYLPLVLRNY